MNTCIKRVFLLSYVIQLLKKPHIVKNFFLFAALFQMINLTVCEAALTPIARSDVVPYQRIKTGETFNFGVVAFHKEGIQRVDFIISGQGYSKGVKSTSSMTHNPRTDVWEYWVGISASEFTSDGVITVTPKVTGNDGGTRTLNAVTMYVNPKGTLPNYAAWVDGTTGSDSTGVIDNSSLPFRTIAAAMDGLLTANGNDLSGCNIYLNAGEYNFSGAWKTRTVSAEWLTIRNTDGVASTDVKITAGGPAANLAKLKVEGITIQSQGADLADVVFIGSTTDNLWTNNCRIIGSGRYSGTYSNPIYFHSGSNDDSSYWSTDCYTYDVQEGYRKIKMVRGATLEKIGNDVFHNTPVVINTTANDIDNGGSGAHADCFQLHTAGPIDPQDNIIVFGYKVTDAHYQGFFLGIDEEVPPNDIRTNIALVNVLIEMREPANNNGTGGFVLSAGSIEGGWDHLLLWNCTFPYAAFVTRHTSLTNSSFIGNIFWQFRHNDGVTGDHNPSFSEAGNAGNNEFRENHYYYVYGLTNSCTGTSVDQSKSYPCPHWYAKSPDSDSNISATYGDDNVLDDSWTPLSGTVILDRFSSVVPVDMYSKPRENISDVGAIERVSGLNTPSGFKIIAN